MYLYKYENYFEYFKSYFRDRRLDKFSDEALWEIYVYLRELQEKNNTTTDYTEDIFDIYYGFTEITKDNYELAKDGYDRYCVIIKTLNNGNLLIKDKNYFNNK